MATDSGSGGGDHKHKPSHSSLPESSLSWCLAHLCRPKPKTETQNQGKDWEKRSKMAQWKALVAIRTHHIKGDRLAITKFRRHGGLKPLLEVIKHPDANRKTLDVALSILGNCCTEMASCVEVRKLDGINIVVDVMKRHVALVTVQNRAARVLGNLAMDPESAALIHTAGGVALLLLCVSQSSSPSSPTSSTPPSSYSSSLSTTSSPCDTPSASPAPSTSSLSTLSPQSEASSPLNTMFFPQITTPSPPSTPNSSTSSLTLPPDTSPKLECAQSAARALFYLSETPSNRLSLITQGTLYTLAPLIAPEYPQALRRTTLRTIHELTKGCGVECAREVSRSGVLSELGIMASGEAGKPLEELALKTLANLCSQGCLRPLIGSLDVIQKFIHEVKKDPLKSGVYLKALCLCCKEAVNRAKVKDRGGLEVLICFLASHQSHSLSRLAISACADFLFDEAAIEQMQDLGLVPLLVARLVKLTRGEEQISDKMDTSLTLNMSPSELMPPECFDSFDFPPPEEKKEQGSSSFLSLRSWLLSEGLISSEGDLLNSSASVDSEWTNLHHLTTPQNPTTSTSVGPPQKHVPPVNSSTPSSSKNPDPNTPVTPPVTSSQPTSSNITSPVKTPVSPTKFCSPHRKRQREKASILAKFTLETPPTVSRHPTSYHPYHPEPWTPESHILLLLSRFSHVPDPSAALVTSFVMSGLLDYLSHHPDPSSRCFRMLCRLSVNPNCLQALVRSGSVGLIQHLLCEREKQQREEGQSARVQAKVRQFGESLLSNLRVQCESGFGAGVLSHVMLSGSESDKIHCALSLPLISSNKTLLKKLLLDSGGLMLALQPLTDADDINDDQTNLSEKLLLHDPPHSQNLHLSSLYFPLLIGCLSALISDSKMSNKTQLNPDSLDVDPVSPPPSKKPRLADSCPYSSSNYDLFLLLDDGTKIPANRVAVSGVEASNGSEYFRALLTGGFGEANSEPGDAISIKDVSVGMLTPVLHYLHGCRFAIRKNSKTTAREKCQILNTTVSAEISQNSNFEKTSLGKMMIGACRFLVNDLQQDLEELCVSLLTSSLDNVEKAARKDREMADEILAHRTSELELNAKMLTEDKKADMLAKIAAQKSKCKEKMLAKEDIKLQPKRKNPDFGDCGSFLGLLSQMYWFSQRHSYPQLGQTCLKMLMGPVLPQSVTGECFRRLAKEADCVGALKRDIMSLATAALVS